MNRKQKFCCKLCSEENQRKIGRIYRKSNRLKDTEMKALNFLKLKGIEVDLEKSLLKGYPDLICKNSKQYEIKKIIIRRYSPTICMTEKQINFDDDISVLVFDSVNIEPIQEIKIKDIKKFIKYKQLKISKKKDIVIFLEPFNKYITP